MRIYNIYLDRIEINFGNSTLEYILISLSQDLYQEYLSKPLGKGITYRRMSYLIEDFINSLDFTKPVDEVSVVGVIRHSLSFLRCFTFSNFQIHIYNKL